MCNRNPRANRRSFDSMIYIFIVLALALSSNSYGLARETRTSATINMRIEASGDALVSVFINLRSPLSDAQRLTLQNCLGVELRDPRSEYPVASSDDEDVDSDEPERMDQEQQQQTEQATKGVPEYYFLHGEGHRTFARNGRVVDDQLDVRALTQALRDAQVGSLTLSVSHPQTGYSDFPKSIMPGGRPELPSLSALGMHYYYFDFSKEGQIPASIHIAFGYPASTLLKRLSILGVLFILPIMLVLRKRRILSRAKVDDSAVRRFACLRTLNALSLGFPIIWWVAFELAGVEKVFGFFENGRGSVSGMVLNAAFYFVPPTLCILICKAVLDPFLETEDRGRQKNHKHFKEAGHLLLGSYLPLLLLFAGISSLMGGHFIQAFLLFSASQGVKILSRSIKAGDASFAALSLIVKPLRERVFELANRSGISLNEVYVLPEETSKTANACATLKNNVVLNEFLLRRFSKREVDAVVGHELGHLRLHHVKIRLAAFYAALLLGMFVSSLGGALIGLLAALYRPAVKLLPYVYDFGVSYPLGMAFALAVLLMLSRRFEYSADSFSATTTGDPEAMITGLAKLARLNLLPMNWSRFDESIFTHPSTLRRIDAIARKHGIPKQRVEALLATGDGHDENYSLTDTGSLPVGDRAAPRVTGLRIPSPAYARPYASGPVWTKPKAKVPKALIPAQLAVTGAAAGYWLSEPGTWLHSVLATHNIPTWPVIMLSALVALLLCSYWLKLKILGVMPKVVRFDRASPDQFSGLDTAALQTYTSDLESLGFVCAADYTLDNRSKNNLSSFARLFVHREQRCFAEVNQVMRGNLAITPMRCTMLSLMDSGWSFSSTNADPNPIYWANRLPKSLWIRKPEASPPELFETHLIRRADMTQRLGVNVTTDMSTRCYLTRQGESAFERRKKVKKKSSLLYLIEMDLVERRPKYEWMGKLDGPVAKQEANYSPGFAGAYNRER